MAFAAPQIITGCGNKTPAASLFLLDHLQNSKYGVRFENEILNTRIEIQENTKSGLPQKPVSMPGEPEIDWEHTNWIDSVLRTAIAIKPGMTRKDLLKVFREEGGLSTRTHQEYVVNQCPYIKVDVDFAVVNNPEDKITKMPDDKIVRVSRPYLEYTIAD